MSAVAFAAGQVELLALLPGSLGAFSAAVIAGAGAGALSNLAGQAVSNLVGLQSGFSWQSLAVSTAAGGVSGGLGKLPGLSSSAAGATRQQTQQLTAGAAAHGAGAVKASLPTLMRKAMLRGALSSASSQLLEMSLGMRHGVDVRSILEAAALGAVDPQAEGEGQARLGQYARERLWHTAVDEGVRAVFDKHLDMKHVIEQVALGLMGSLASYETQAVLTKSEDHTTKPRDRDVPRSKTPKETGYETHHQRRALSAAHQAGRHAYPQERYRQSESHSRGEGRLAYARDGQADNDAVLGPSTAHREADAHTARSWHAAPSWREQVKTDVALAGWGPYGEQNWVGDDGWLPAYDAAFHVGSDAAFHIGSDAVADLSQWQGLRVSEAHFAAGMTRFTGALEAASGVAQVGLAGELAGVGAVLGGPVGMVVGLGLGTVFGVHGGDNIQAGVRQAAGGHSVKPATEVLLGQVLSPRAAARIEMGLEFAGAGSGLTRGLAGELSGSSRYIGSLPVTGLPYNPQFFQSAASSAGARLNRAAAWTAQRSPRMGLLLEKFGLRGPSGVGAEGVVPGTGLKARSLSNVEVREWYHKQLADIPNQIDKSLPLREQGLQAFKMRNDIKLQARALMRDQKLASTLPPPKTLKYEVRKLYGTNTVGDDLWLNMIDSSQRTNAAVDNALDIENTFAPLRSNS
ncbi:MAG: hypothetical protein Tsb005_12280 [Gammaproteobacteria bacterium]